MFPYRKGHWSAVLHIAQTCCTLRLTLKQGLSGLLEELNLAVAQDSMTLRKRPACFQTLRSQPSLKHASAATPEPHATGYPVRWTVQRPQATSEYDVFSPDLALKSTLTGVQQRHLPVHFHSDACVVTPMASGCRASVLPPAACGFTFGCTARSRRSQHLRHHLA
jgi:hypothetical protein